MSCELWVGGSGRAGIAPADNYSSGGATYYEFFVSVNPVAPTGQPSVVPRRANPQNTNYTYDIYFHDTSISSGRVGYPSGMWSVYDPPKYFYKGSCPPAALATPLNLNQRHDCINGKCLPMTTYKTPGQFYNRTACESGCANNSPCKGECVELIDIANLSQAVITLKSKICK